MTVRAHTTHELQPLEPTAPAGDMALVTAHSGCIVAGAVGGDVIVISHRALAIIRAGLHVRALIMHGLASVCRTIVIASNKALRLENGIYQPV